MTSNKIIMRMTRVEVGDSRFLINHVCESFVWYVQRLSVLWSNSDQMKNSDLRKDHDLLEHSGMLISLHLLRVSDLLFKVSCTEPRISWISCLQWKSLLLSPSLDPSSWKLLRLLWRAELGSAGILNIAQKCNFFFSKVEHVWQNEYKLNVAIGWNCNKYGYYGKDTYHNSFIL